MVLWCSTLQPHSLKIELALYARDFGVLIQKKSPNKKVLPCERKRHTVHAAQLSGPSGVPPVLAGGKGREGRKGRGGEYPCPGGGGRKEGRGKPGWLEEGREGKGTPVLARGREV